MKTTQKKQDGINWKNVRIKEQTHEKLVEIKRQVRKSKGNEISFDKIISDKIKK